MTDIPSPTDTGANGTQQVTKQDSETIVAHSPLEGLPIARALEGLIASRPKSISGEATAGLLAGCFQYVSQELQQSQKNLQTTRSDLDRAREDLSICKQRTAVLQERVNSLASSRNLKNLCITVGMALLGIAAELMKNNMKEISYVLVGFGTLLTLFGWLTSGGEKRL